MVIKKPPIDTRKICFQIKLLLILCLINVIVYVIVGSHDDRCKNSLTIFRPRFFSFDLSTRLSLSVMITFDDSFISFMFHYMHGVAVLTVILSLIVVYLMITRTPRTSKQLMKHLMLAQVSPI